MVGDTASGHSEFGESLKLCHLACVSVRCWSAPPRHTRTKPKKMVTANSIKHRKSSAESTLASEGVSSVESSIRESAKAHHGCFLLLNFTRHFSCTGVTLAIAALVLIPTSNHLLFTPSLPSSKPANELENHPTLLPVSNLVPVSASLLGTHSLGKEYLLQNNSARHDPDTHDIVAGIIHYPHVDLSSLLKEDALESELYRGLRIPLSNSKLLDDSSTFNTVIGVVREQHTDPANKKVAGHALLTRCGYKMGKVPNQDRSLIVNYFIDIDMEKEDHQYTALMMGIFDGHGPRGHEVSHYLALELPKIFARIVRQKQNSLPLPFYESLRNSIADKYQITNLIKNALTETFIEADANQPVMDAGGSTASVLFYPGLDSKVYIANAGDSTTLIVSYHKTKRKSTLAYQNRKHKPHLPDERQRIENAGGIVKIPLSILQGDVNINDGIQETSRVIIPDKDGNPFRGMALAMSRSIGDVEGKRVGLTAEPEIDVWDVNDWKRQFDFDHNMDTEVTSSLFYVLCT